ncbi:MAG: DNA-binding protein [Candidatus Contendobacter sp.]|nr:MAG: DNA-binding protein [Candidatus Contendobacter sp.]
MSFETIATTNIDWPPSLTERLGADAPRQLWLLGDPALLAARKTALFCSARCPGDALLRAHDTAARLRDQGETVISGFHSPVERDCLNILLRGRQPLIICPARALDGMRLPSAWQTAINAGRLLLLSPFEKTPRRVTADSARRRNALVAALADRVFIAHAAHGGQIAALATRMNDWCIPGMMQDNPTAP